MKRTAYLAGQWYPGQNEQCRRAIEQHAEEVDIPNFDWHGLIGPHAGWSFSGDAAGRAYRALARRRQGARTAVIFGSHRGMMGPNTVFLGDGWETPLGELTTDRALAQRLADELRLEEEPVAPLRPDNAVELHLPFIKYFFPSAQLVMLGVEAGPQALEIGRRVGEALSEDGKDAIIIGSTDLTHYGPGYGFTPAGHGEEAVAWVRNSNDRGFIDAVLAGDAAAALEHGLSHQSACGAGAAAGAMQAALVFSGALHPHLVDHYLSYDVHPASSFVGYAGILL